MTHASLPYFFAAFLLAFSALISENHISDVRAEDVSSPVVVELFTSQGCSSCPPADKILGELIDRDNVIALSLPVDYWDNLGWRDTFASPHHTQRQRDYAVTLGTRQVYTPQMVINGHINVVGSRRNKVMQSIADELQHDHEKVDISLAAAGDDLVISLSDAPSSIGSTIDATVWIVPFHQGMHSVSIERGENRGKTIAYSNVVDGLMRLGEYNGAGTDFTHSLAPLQNKSVDGCAVIVQDDVTGEIIGAQRIDVAFSS